MKSWAIGLGILLAGVSRGQEPGAAAREAGGMTVLVLPFAAVGPAAGSQWIGEAIQRNVLNELVRARSVVPVTPTTRPAETPNDAQSARQAANKAAATHVVFGSYQVNETGIRITGQVLDSRSGAMIAAAKATGAMRDLFALEDSIAEQVRSALSREVAAKDVAAMVPVVAPGVRQIAQQKLPGAEPDGPVWGRFPWDDETNWARGVWDRPNRYDSDYYGSYRRVNYSYGWYRPYTYYRVHPYFRRPAFRYGGALVIPGGFIRVGGGW